MYSWAEGLLRSFLRPFLCVMDKLKIVIDFDGTCVKHAFPAVGDAIGAAPVLRALVSDGHMLLLSTMRCDHGDVSPTSDDPNILQKGGSYLTEALAWFKENAIPLYGVQSCPGQQSWTKSPKCYGDLYIDDSALGIPLVHPEDGNPYVDWRAVSEILFNDGILSESSYDGLLQDSQFLMETL